MINDFIFHKISEKEKKEIEKQAKDILNDFSKKLLKINKNLEEPSIEKQEFERNEEEEIENKFNREIMFENALKKNKNFILGEKAKW
ncbi:MAG: hypothetical protein ACOC3Z_02785 [Nanoarchaeota archaeon]